MPQEEFFQEQLDLLQEKERKYEQEPKPVNLGVLLGLLLAEAITAFSLTYASQKDILKSLSIAAFPVAITVAAASYQAREYHIPQEQEKLSEEYVSLLNNSKSATNTGSTEPVM